MNAGVTRTVEIQHHYHTNRYERFLAYERGLEHKEPFSQCLVCLSNLDHNAILSAETVRLMREYAEEPA